MSTRGQYICLWTAPIVGAIWLICFLMFPGFMTPMSPAMTADEVAAFYRDPANVDRIRYSMILYNWFGIGLMPLYGVIVVQMRRMVLYSEVFAYGFLATAAAGATLFAITDLYFQLAAFRPDRDPAIMQLLNDMAWITFTAPVTFIMAQCLSLALGIYLDRQPKPVFSAWVGHFNVLVAIVVAPAVLSSMHLTGPFAWDGFWSFWVRTGAITLWGIVMFFVCWGAVTRQKREQPEPQGVALQGAAP